MCDDLDGAIAGAAQELEAVLQAGRDESARKGWLPQGHLEALTRMEETMWVDTHWDIAWPVWPRGLGAKVTALAQKIVRGAISWYVDRIIGDQNRHNFTTYRTVQILSEEVRELRAGQIRDRARIEALSDDVANLKRRLFEAQEGR